MKITVPVLASKDILIIGGTLKAIRTALDLRAAGYSVFVATPYAYLGEDLCATLDLQSRKTADYKALFGDVKMRLPSEIKRSLDQQLIDSDIDFLFQLRPVRPAYDSEGIICGALFANRSGFHTIAAKVVVDATERQTFARAAQLPMQAFVPGSYSMQLFAIGGVNTESAALTIRKLGRNIIAADRKHPAFEVTKEIDLTSNSMFEIAKASVAFRQEVWDSKGVAYGEQIIIDLQDGVENSYSPSVDSPVAIANSTTPRKIATIADKRPKPAPVGFNETAIDHPFEIVRKDLYFRFRDCPTLEFDLNAIPVINTCDVLVIGGGTGGAPATIGAARAGMHTVCVENLPSLGGVMLAGRIGSYWYGNRVGFTQEIDTGIQKMASKPDPGITASKTNVIWKNQWFMEKATEKDAEIIFDTMTVAAAMDGNTACGAVLISPYGIGVVTASFVIDATGNSDFVAATGAETACDLKDEAAVQGAGLSPIQLGNSYTNTDFTFVLDNDIVDATRAFVTARAKYTEAFDVVSILNTRERRRIIGDIVLQPMDFFANRIYSDTITIARSNFDTHGFVIHPMFLIKPTDEGARFANVPLRALLPAGFEGMAATGLSVSAHRDCMPLIRMQPDVQNQGYAMGLAAAIAVKEKSSIRAINIRTLQKKLVAEGILPKNVLTQTDTACTPLENDPYHDISRIFMNPESALEALKNKLEANPKDTETAITLAFLGDASGRQLITDTILTTPWDQGWDYRGMGQFGFSMSPLDVMIVALTNIGGDEQAILAKLKTLTIDSAFSHIRAISLALIRNPIMSASDGLARVLEMPGAVGHAIQTFHDALQSNRPDYNDNTLRNAQLKEVYLAKALATCNPGSQMARTILNAYIKGMQGLYAIFAGA